MIEEQKRQKARCYGVMTSLTPELVKRLDAVAERQVTSRSLLIRQACEMLLRQCEQKGVDAS